jgi:hypothetical protein
MYKKLRVAMGDGQSGHARIKLEDCPSSDFLQLIHIQEIPLFDAAKVFNK